MQGWGRETIKSRLFSYNAKTVLHKNFYMKFKADKIPYKKFFENFNRIFNNFWEMCQSKSLSYEKINITSLFSIIFASRILHCPFKRQSLPTMLQSMKCPSERMYYWMLTSIWSKVRAILWFHMDLKNEPQRNSLHFLPLEWIWYPPTFFACGHEISRNSVLEHDLSFRTNILFNVLLTSDLKLKNLVIS